MSMDKRNAGDVETIFRAPFNTPALRALPLTDRAMSMYLLGKEEQGSTVAVLVARVDAEGGPDVSFGNGGVASVSVDLPRYSFPLGMVPTDDGGVIAVVRADGVPQRIGLVRLKDDGSLDKTFGNDGVIIHDIPEVRSDANGTKSLQREVGISPFQDAHASGSHGEISPAKGGGLYFAWNTGLGGPAPGGLLRTMPNGFIDKSFGRDGYVDVYYPGNPQTLPRGVQELSDGSVVVVGALWQVADGEFPAFAARFDSRGKPDLDFGTDGFFILRGNDTPQSDVVTLTFTSAAELSDGAIVFSGGMMTTNRQGYGLLAAVDRSGTPLASFNGGKPVIFGLLGSYESFNDGGMVTQDDDKIVVGGFSAAGPGTLPADMLVARFLSDGRVDTSFASPRGWVKVRPLGNEYNYTYSLSLTADGKILVAGDAGREGPVFIPAVVRVSS